MAEQTSVIEGTSGSSGDWSAYDAWNLAIEAVFFDGRNEGRPVYLDLEEHVLEEAHRLAGGSGDALASLDAAVRETLALEAPGPHIFREHREFARAWDDAGREVEPPFLALLAFFSSVAEGMRTDERFSSNNYYSRLCERLGVDPSWEGPWRDPVTSAYRDDASRLWPLYNGWLEDSNGQRGIPTAYAYNHLVYVGVPISQALVRAHDRERLTDLFVAYRLRPGQQFSGPDMVRLLKEWLPHSPMSPTFKRFCDSKDALERVADIARIALQTWDGKVEQATSGEATLTAPILLAATLRSHPAPSVELSLVTRTALAMPDGPYRLDGDATPHALAALAPAGGELTLGPQLADGTRLITGDSQPSIPDMLLATATLSHAGATLRREPRRLLILEWDEALWSYAEVPRAHIGTRSLLLVLGDLAEALVESLATSARPGYTISYSHNLPGLPDEWVALAPVDLIAPPEVTSPDLAALIPVSWSDVTLEGGFRLPSRATWLKGEPPVVSVALADGEMSEALLVNESIGESGPRVTKLGPVSGGELLELPRLEDGDYRVEIERKSAAIASTALRIRSGDSPRALAGDEHEVIGYDPATALRSLSGSVGEGDISGARVASLTPSPNGNRALPPASLGSVHDPVWARDDIAAPESGSAAAGPPPACLSTGAHYFVLPPAGPERVPYGARVDGACKLCGLEKWFPARPRGKWKGRGRGGQRKTAPTARDATRKAARAPAREIARAIVTEVTGSADALLDALSYARTGSWQAFEGMASQVSDEPWYAGDIAQTLSALGHVDLSLDLTTARPQAWAISPAVIATLPDDTRSVLCGRRSRSLIAMLKRELGGDIAIEEMPGNVTVVTAEADEATCELLTVAAEEAEFILTVSLEPARQIAASLPGLATVASALRRVPRPVGMDLEIWDPTTGKWRETDTTGEPGLYRTRRFPRRFGYRVAASHADELLVTDAVLGKWLAASEHGVSLIAYEPESRTLSCALGAQLPGLYGRAAALCSGNPPTPRKDGTVTYPRVPSDVASSLWASLEPTGMPLEL